MRRPNSTGTDDEIVRLGHPPSGLDNLFLVVRDDLDLLELDTEVETLFGEKVRVRVATTVPRYRAGQRSDKRFRW